MSESIKDAIIFSLVAIFMIGCGVLVYNFPKLGLIAEIAMGAGIVITVVAVFINAMAGRN